MNGNGTDAYRGDASLVDRLRFAAGNWPALSGLFTEAADTLERLNERARDCFAEAVDAREAAARYRNALVKITDRRPQSEGEAACVRIAREELQAVADRLRAKRTPLHVIDGPATPEQVRDALKKHGAVVFSAAREDDFGFDPEAIARSEREVEAGHSTPAREFFARLRARVTARRQPEADR